MAKPMWRRKLNFAFLIASILVSCSHHEDPMYTRQIEGASFNGGVAAWITLKWGELLHTEDGGTVWKTSKVGDDGFEQISFVDRSKGWAVDINGQIWRTADAGQSWKAIGRIEPTPETSLTKAKQLWFVDELHGFVVDSFSLWCTNDGGLSWNRCIPHERGKGTPQRYFQLNSTRAWVAATDGYIYRTENGGVTWEKQKIASDIDFTDIVFVDEHTGWVCGDPNGTILRTDDGGKTWKDQLRQTESNIGLESIEFSDKKNGWAVGRIHSRTTSEPTKGIVLHSVDGGETWITIDIGANEFFFYRIHFVNSKIGWLLGQKNVYRTDDSGQTWRIVWKPIPS